MLWYKPLDIIKYQDQLKDGDIFIYHRVGNWFNAFGAKLIQWGSGGPFNHTDFVYKDSTGKLRVIFADLKNGVCDREWEKTYGKLNVYIMVLRPTIMQDGRKYNADKDGKGVIEIAKKYIGLKYDWMALSVFFFKAMGLGIFNKWNPFHLRNRYFCSENVVKVEREYGVDICPSYNESSVSINQLFLDPENQLEFIVLEPEIKAKKNTELKKELLSKKSILNYEQREILMDKLKEEIIKDV